MSEEKYDPATGRKTTGHEWNGIEELNTPVPRIVIFFLVVGGLFAIGYWILMPSWPLGTTHTKGLLGIDQRDIVAKDIKDALAARNAWGEQLMRASLADVKADTAMQRRAQVAGRVIFDDNCAACHGDAGRGGRGFPNLAAKAWLWGGDLKTLEQTIRAGINSTARDTRVSQMMAFGRDGVLDRDQILNVSAYVRSLSAQLDEKDQKRITAGQGIFAANCVSCHGVGGKGDPALGAPDLTDANWLYGGDVQSVFTTIYGGRQGHMPHWEGRLSPLEIRLLAIYVSLLGDGKAEEMKK